MHAKERCMRYGAMGAAMEGNGPPFGVEEALRQGVCESTSRTYGPTLHVNTVFGYRGQGERENVYLK